MGKKTKKLKKLLKSNQLNFLMEAHNGLSAKIVEEAGFKGIWASGLSISAALGVRDNNEASWTQVLEVLEFMSDATNIPIMLDGDTGYGNFNNVRRLVKKLEQRQVAGVCIEDKLFPKTNSFIGGDKQPLADIMEFSGKIKAAKDAQTCGDFVVVARIEAFIAGWGLEEALRRAEAYREAGADAILVHSKRKDPSEIIEFMKEWSNRLPVIIVPTKYFSTPTELYRDLNISMVIWANHNLRAAVSEMKKTSKQIFMDQSLIDIENNVASVSEIFRLQGAHELEEAENKYLPAPSDVNAIILAASQGSLGELTREIPKTMLKVSGKSILIRLVEDFNKVGINNVTVVRGFAKDKVIAPNINTIDNNNYLSTKDLYSLYLARDLIKGNTIISYGDIVFKSYILNNLLNDQNDITIVVDADVDMNNINNKLDVRDFVKTIEPYSRKLYSSTVGFVTVSSQLNANELDGEFIGVWKVSANGALLVKTMFDELSLREDFNELTVSDLFNKMNTKQNIAVMFIKGSWLDVDTIVDLQKAGELI